MTADTTHTHSGATNPQFTSPLFKLPLELRLDIYNLYIDSELQLPHFMVYSTTYLTDLANSRVYRASPPPALALTCKRVYRDIAPLFQNLFAIHVMPARWGLRIGMGGYSRPSPAESDGFARRWDPTNPFDGGGMVLSNMTKCVLRMNDPEMEGMDSLADFFAQVVSNAERERTKPALWDADRHRLQAERGIVSMYMENVLPPPPPSTAPTTVYDVRTRRMRGMGALMPDVGPSRGNGLGMAAEGVRELVFDWAPIKTPGWRKVVPEGLKETRAEQEKTIQERFWDLVVGMDSLEVLRLRGDCPGWWKGYLEKKMEGKIKEGKFRIVMGS